MLPPPPCKLLLPYQLQAGRLVWQHNGRMVSIRAIRPQVRSPLLPSDKRKFRRCPGTALVRILPLYGSGKNTAVLGCAWININPERKCKPCVCHLCKHIIWEGQPPFLGSVCRTSRQVKHVAAALLVPLYAQPRPIAFNGCGYACFAALVLYLIVFYLAVKGKFIIRLRDFRPGCL